MLKSIIAVSTGSAAGALLRWQLGVRLNGLLPALPFGTLAANLVGGYLVGLAIAFFSLSPGIAPEWRLAIVTGFCGGLTTFSTFSAEIAALLREGRLAWAAAAILLHVAGSLLMTLAGMASWRWLQG
ncbi:MAG: fluoride efflux transporter CrcB [Candidatus Accumulibacter sp.]|jgi:CrcB protein|nr:fluoride efflux transporter CrcB [Accumulibacter sp.]